MHFPCRVPGTVVYAVVLCCYMVLFLLVPFLSASNFSSTWFMAFRLTPLCSHVLYMGHTVFLPLHLPRGLLGSAYWDSTAVARTALDSFPFAHLPSGSCFPWTLLRLSWPLPGGVLLHCLAHTCLGFTFWVLGLQGDYFVHCTQFSLFYLHFSPHSHTLPHLHTSTFHSKCSFPAFPSCLNSHN